MYYNTALIGVETNYSTYPEMKLEDLGYPNLYVRERLDNYTGKMVPAFGFETTTVTRPVIVDGLKDAAREHLETINDYETLGEMLTRWPSLTRSGCSRGPAWSGPRRRGLPCGRRICGTTSTGRTPRDGNTC